MSNFEARRKEKKKEKLAAYFFNLSQLTYTALVLGNMALFFQEAKVNTMMTAMLVVGCLLAFVLAKIGNNLLK